MGADLRVWCSQCGVPASVLVSDCTYGQSPNPRRVAAAPSRNFVTVEHRAGHDGFDEFFDHTACAITRAVCGSQPSPTTPARTLTASTTLAPGCPPRAPDLRYNDRSTDTEPAMV